LGCVMCMIEECRNCVVLGSSVYSALSAAPEFPLFPYTTLFRSCASSAAIAARQSGARSCLRRRSCASSRRPTFASFCRAPAARRSEEHTSELQSHGHLVCRLLLEKKKSKDGDSHLQFNAPLRRA